MDFARNAELWNTMLPHKWKKLLLVHLVVLVSAESHPNHRIQGTLKFNRSGTRNAARFFETLDLPNDFLCVVISIYPFICVKYFFILVAGKEIFAKKAICPYKILFKRGNAKVTSRLLVLFYVCLFVCLIAS